MSQSDVPIQNSQYVALFDDFCILVAPESDFPREPVVSIDGLFVSNVECEVVTS